MIAAGVVATTPERVSSIRRAFPSSCPGTIWLMIIGHFAAIVSCTVAPPALLISKMALQHQARQLIAPADDLNLARPLSRSNRFHRSAQTLVASDRDGQSAHQASRASPRMISGAARPPALIM